MKGRRLRKNKGKGKNQKKKEVAWKPEEKRTSRRVWSEVSETADQLSV